MTPDLPCKRCAASNRDTRAHLVSYWGDPLCRPCATAVAELLDRHGKWPPVPWNESDEAVLSDG